jgi:hypothetical protein
MSVLDVLWGGGGVVSAVTKPITDGRADWSCASNLMEIRHVMICR